MSRPLRIEYPDAWYHVMNRGRRREKIFLTDRDRRAFIKVLQEASELWNFKIAAFCLMANHYHLLIQTPDSNLSRGMRHINGVYTQRFNREHKTDGQLFRGRYKSVLVEADNHLLEALRYIHKNPLKSGMINTLSAYRWSSHQGYVSKAKKWSWLHKDDILTMLSPTKKRQKSAYLDFVAQGEPEEIEKFYSLKNLPSILGSDLFKETIRDNFYALANQPEIPESKFLAPNVNRVILAVCTFYRVSQEELFISKRGNKNLPRDVSVYLVRHLCHMTLPCIGREFGIQSYSTVSSIVQRVKLQIKQDKRLSNDLNAIKKAATSQKRT